jgi:hypothetical protein
MNPPGPFNQMTMRKKKSWRTWLVTERKDKWGYWVVIDKRLVKDYVEYIRVVADGGRRNEY